ncbi:hypothetical protein M413DRAFT_32767 [Hebeloma cylindrosporum]|uniref:Uncharacterized protein n=1 Tax=Hebeloma cylindrosporum TaxID=76867 RepID=A0A0C3BEA5_HEBCY|nr:hypothetical protein M413DRAFT_32767 [Hebeloma cylindrosporum h7]
MSLPTIQLIAPLCASCAILQADQNPLSEGCRFTQWGNPCTPCWNAGHYNCSFILSPFEADHSPSPSASILEPNFAALCKSFDELDAAVRSCLELAESALDLRSKVTRLALVAHNNTSSILNSVSPNVHPIHASVLLQILLRHEESHRPFPDRGEDVQLSGVPSRLVPSFYPYSSLTWYLVLRLFTSFQTCFIIFNTKFSIFF